MTKEQLDQFYNEGYVILENWLEAELLEAAKLAISRMSDTIIEDLYRAGKITSKASSLHIALALRDQQEKGFCFCHQKVSANQIS